MEQYINKATLVAELEKRRDAALTRQHNLNTIGQETVLNEMLANELNRIISSLDTLEVKGVDLKEEVERFAKECGYKSAATIDFQFAKHFFELGLKAQKEEPASEDLEGEVVAFLDQYTYPREEVDFSSFARHIAQWQKQQMMKEVIVGRFTFNPSYPDNDHIVIDKDELPKYKLGDKVKLIVIKED